jgi:DNA-directed RNA polymerase specialized sigma24 family protein
LISPLPSVPRCVFYMREVMELTNAETASRMETTEAATRVAFSRAWSYLTAKHRRDKPRGNRR